MPSIKLPTTKRSTQLPAKVPNPNGTRNSGHTHTIGRVDHSISEAVLPKAASIQGVYTMNNIFNEGWHPTEEEIFFGDALEKTAAPIAPAKPPVSTFGQNLMSGLGMGLGGLAVTMAGMGISKMIQRSEDRQNMRRYEESLRTAMQMSPMLQRHRFEELRAYLPMVVKASPTVASEPRLLANYLETMIDAEGNLNLATFGELASLENNLLRNNQSRYSLRDAVLTEGAKGIAKGTVDSFYKNRY